MTDLRRTLVAAAEGWRKTNERYLALMHAQPPAETPAEIRDAYAGSLMAYGYGYCLAAILGVAERELGPDAAKRLAFDADEMLTNGDFDDLNGDVTPGAPAESSSAPETAGILCDPDAAPGDERDPGADGSGVCGAGGRP